MRRYSPYNHFTLFCLHPGKKKRFYLSSFHNFLNRFYPGLSCESFSSIFFFYKTRAEINRRKICILYFLLSCIDDIITFWHPLQKKLFIFFRCSNLPRFFLHMEKCFCYLRTFIHILSCQLSIYRKGYFFFHFFFPLRIYIQIPPAAKSVVYLEGRGRRSKRKGRKKKSAFLSMCFSPFTRPRINTNTEGKKSKPRSAIPRERYIS